MRKLWLGLLLVVLSLSLSGLFSPAGFAQQSRKQAAGYYLPRASFPTFAQSQQQSSGGAGELPSIGGVHLVEGQDRRPGTGVQPYDPGEPSLNMALVRWDPRRFPLKVWISDGKQLPEVAPQLLQEDRCNRVAAMRSSPKSFFDLPTCHGWQPQMNDSVATGFEQWRDMEKEGVISFGFVDDPAAADILVFFTDKPLAADGPGGTYVPALTMGQVFTAQQMQTKMSRGEPTVPIVMEFRADEELNRLQANAAHEFGHALGIKAHSPYRQDIMYLNRMVDNLSPADKATLRALYKHTPKYWYY